MKFTSKISAGLVSMGLLAAVFADEPVKFSVPGVTAPDAPAAQAAAPAAKPAPKFTETQVLEAYGWYTGMRLGLSQLGFTKEQVEAVGRGLVRSISGPAPSELKDVGPEIEAFLSKKNEAYVTRLRMENLAQGAAYFTKLKENKNVTVLPSGLCYEVTKPGTGATPKIGQTVSIHYTGSLTTGQVFDTSLQPRQQGAPIEPVDMVLQPGQLIPGMVEGLQKVAVGGKIKLYIPPSLAYGDEGSQAIPPGATLIFDVELLSAKDTPAAPMPATK